MEETPSLADWLRHYAWTILTFVVAGALLFGVRELTNPGEYRSFTVLVSGELASRAAGPAALVLFDSPEVARRAAETLGVDEGALEENSDLRVVPNTPLMLVEGAARGPDAAEATSIAMARAFQDALEEEGSLANLVEIFDGPQPARFVNGPRASMAALGAGVGLCLGLAAAAALYGYRRPVMTMWNAAALCGARRVTLLDAKGRSWLPPRRARPALGDTPRNRDFLARLADSGERALGAGPGGDAPARRLPVARAATHLAAAASSGSPSRRPFVVAHAGTRRRDLEAARWDAPAGSEGPELAWVRT